MAVSTEERWKAHNETGRRHFERAEFAEAEQEYIAALRQATLLGAVTLTELGQVAFSLRDFTQSESYFRRALTIREQALGMESVDLMQALNDLAAPYLSRGELEQAERLYRRALAIGDAQLGELHVDMTVTLSNLARLHNRKNEWRAAAPLLGRLLAIKQKALGESHPHSISLMLAVASARSSLGEHEVAEEMVRRALALQERAQAGDVEMVRTLTALAKIYTASREDAARQRDRRQGRSAPEAGGDGPARHETRARGSTATRPISRSTICRTPSRLAAAAPSLARTSPVPAHAKTVASRGEPKAWPLRANAAHPANAEHPDGTRADQGVCTDDRVCGGREARKTSALVVEDSRPITARPMVLACENRELTSGLLTASRTRRELSSMRCALLFLLLAASSLPRADGHTGKAASRAPTRWRRRETPPVRFGCSTPPCARMRATARPGIAAEFSPGACRERRSALAS